MKILVAYRDGGRSAALAAQLQAQDGLFKVISVQDGENLLDRVETVTPDVVIVDMARADRDGLDSIRAIKAKQRLPVVLFVDDDDPAFMEEAIAAGVTSYHVHEVDLPAIKPILRTAMAFFRHIEQLNTRLAEAQGQLAARHLVEAAKRLLMSKDQMSEPAAHKFLQRRAMDSQKRLSEAAAIILKERGVPGAKHD